MSKVDRPLADVALAARAIISHMSRPTNERHALERERDELPAHVANYQRELDATPQDQKERRERLVWQIRRVQKRMADVEARLARVCAESGP
jgi:chromosome segregation ATPase